ncbi:MAG TPA: hypothetical protein VNF47_20535 [Streptosporangiaceae bacterium]|nr:hypothetical protein [Streptosporangiaceae bacterium]
MEERAQQVRQGRPGRLGPAGRGPPAARAGRGEPARDLTTPIPAAIISYKPR